MVASNDARRRLDSACVLRRLRNAEHPPTQEPQICKKCHKLLPARWFAEHAHNRSGRDGHCLACRAKQTRAYHVRIERQPPEQKQCQQCRQTKAAESFYRHGASADGLQPYCKECFKAQSNSRKQARIHVEVPTKRCSRCKVVKPAAEFCPKRQLVDGLHDHCKVCNNRSTLEWRQQRRQQQQQQRQQQPPPLSAAHHGAAATSRTGAFLVPCHACVLHVTVSAPAAETAVHSCPTLQYAQLGCAGSQIGALSLCRLPRKCVSLCDVALSTDLAVHRWG